MQHLHRFRPTDFRDSPGPTPRDELNYWVGIAFSILAGIGLLAITLWIGWLASHIRWVP